MKTAKQRTKAALSLAVAALLLTHMAEAQDLNSDARIRARMERALRRDTTTTPQETPKPTPIAQPTQRTHSTDTLRT